MTVSATQRYFVCIVLFFVNVSAYAQNYTPDSIVKYKVSRMNVYELDSVGHKKLVFSAVYNREGLTVESYGAYDLSWDDRFNYSIDSSRYEYDAGKNLIRKYYRGRRVFNSGEANEQIRDFGYEKTYRYKGNKIFTKSSNGEKSREVKKSGTRQKTITRGTWKGKRSFVRKIYVKNGIEYGVEKQYHSPLRNIRKVIYRWQTKEDNRGCVIDQKEIVKRYYKNPLIRSVRMRHHTTSKCLYEDFFLRKKKTYRSPGHSIIRKGIQRKVVPNEKGSVTENIYEYIIREEGE